MSTKTVSNAAGLMSALASASAGDVILLQSGNYGSVSFNNLNFGSDVTIRSADGNQGATFTNVSFNGSSHIRLDGVHVDSPSNGSDGARLVSIDGGSHHIDIVNSEINGKVDGDYTGWWAVYIGDGADIELTNNYMHDVVDGIVSFGGDRLRITENTLDYIGSDGMKFAGVQDVVIENNTGPRHVYPSAGAHVDFIQFQGSSSNIVIRGNVVLPETEYYAQGIFLADGTYSNVLVEQNIIYSGLIRGVSIDGSSGITVRNNTLLTVPNKGHDLTGIFVDGGNVSNNVTGSNEGGYSGSNLRIEWDNPNGQYAYDKVYQNASAGFGITLEDLRPVAGGPADFGSGMGAEQRLYELLEGGSSTPSTGTPGGNTTSGNKAPVAVDDKLQVQEDGSAVLDPKVNDTDPEGQAITVISVGAAAHGTATLNADGTIRYAPNANYFGNDEFTYVIRDASGATDIGSVGVTVNRVDNDAPDAVNDRFTAYTATATTVDVLANDSDPDGGAVQIQSHGTTAKGTLVHLGNGRFSYTANAGATGTDSFSYTIVDPTGRTDSATVTFDVLELGALPAPVFAGNGLLTGGGKDTVIAAHKAGYVLADGTLELEFTTGALSARQGLFSKDSTGYDNGGHLTVLLEGDDLVIRLQSTSQTYEIRVADKIKAGTDYHLAFTFGSSGMKAYLDGVQVGSNSYKGGLQGNSEPIVLGANQWGSGNNVADVIQDDFNGAITKANLYGEAFSADEVEFLSGLASTPSNPGPANGAPVANDDAATTQNGTAITLDVLANDSDPDGNPLSISSIDQPSFGSVSQGSDGKLTYTPNSGFAGVDSFTYRASDGSLTDTAKVTVTVAPATVPQPAPGASGDVVVSNAAQLRAALDNASGGETIVLRNGDYGSFDFDGYRFGTDVTIRAENAQGAKFSAIGVSGSSHLTIDGVEVANPGNGTAFTAFVEIDASQHISFVNSEVHGKVDAIYDGADGIKVGGNSSNVTIANNEIHDTRNGAVFFGVSDLEVIGNDFEYIGEDSMKFAGITRGLIEDNDGARIYRAANTSVHHDFIQFQGTSSDVVLRGNTLLLSASNSNSAYPVQGIFVKDGVYNGFLIEDNLIYTNTVNGIYISSDPGTGGNITVRQNTVLSPPDITKWGDADIRIISIAGAYTVEKNVVDRVVDEVQTGTVRNNLWLQWENPNAPNHYDDVYAGATEGADATLADFRPVAGGPAGFGSGLGAEERLAELLGGSSAPPASNGNQNGTSGNDTMFATIAAEVIDGKGGIDTADYSGSAAGITIGMARAGSGGSAEGDRLISIERLIGSAHADVLIGTGANPALYGGGGDDILYDSAGKSALYGGAGDDMLNGGAGGDTLDGGAGIDQVRYASSTLAVDANLARGTGLGGDAEGDIYSGIEDLVGSQKNDTLTGDAGDNHLEGLGGNDTLRGGLGADRLEGGSGNDTADYSDSGTGINIGLFRAGTGGTAAGDTLIGIEHIIGSNHNDMLVGGGVQALTLDGGDGNDTLYDYGANGLLVGGAGNDTLHAGAGNDTLNGGVGNDIMNGGTGADTFVYSSADWGRDIILGWEDGIDKIDLRGSGLTFASFAEISTPQGVRLDWSDGSTTHAIHIFGVNADQIDANDFLV